MCKKTTRKKNFYIAVLSELKLSTNLGEIKKKLGISRQHLNYYLRQLKIKGFIVNQEDGWWELTKKGKNPTKYGFFLKKDSVRGHTYIWEVEIEKIPKNWNERIKILRHAEINFKLVGALKTTPRIKVLGRKVWLCNDHLRIFDTEKSSYYGNNAKESRINSKVQALKIITALQNKLGLKLDGNRLKFKKEHYALIKNDLATDQNRKGIIMRIKDDNGEEWLLVDDSLGEGGELENIGKKAYKTNPQMQKWWNKKKENNFKIDDDYIQKGFGQTNDMIMQVTQNQMMFNQNFESHVSAIKELGSSVRELTNQVKILQEENKKLRNGK